MKRQAIDREDRHHAQLGQQLGLGGQQFGIETRVHGNHPQSGDPQHSQGQGHRGGLAQHFHVDAIRAKMAGTGHRHGSRNGQGQHMQIDGQHPGNGEKVRGFHDGPQRLFRRR